jgi:hypothetical protein
VFRALHEYITVAHNGQSGLLGSWGSRVHRGLRRMLRADVWFVRGAQVWINQSTNQ